MQAAQTGSNFCSIYLLYRQKNEKNQYIIQETAGEDCNGKALSPIKGQTLKEVNGNDLSRVDSEELFTLLTKCQGKCPQKQGQFSLSLVKDDESEELHHDTLNLCTDPIIVVTLQNASIELLSEDSDDQITVDASFHTIIQWECKSVEIVDQVDGCDHYVGFTAMGPGFCETAEKITMFAMRGLTEKNAEVAALRSGCNGRYFTCQDGNTLEDEKNETLAGIMASPLNLKEIYENNKSFFFIVKEMPDNTYTFQSARWHEKYLCSAGGTLALGDKSESRFRIPKKTKIQERFS